MKVSLTGWDGKKVGSVVSKVVSGADFAAQHITSPQHASHPMRVILDLDEKSGGWVRIFFCRDVFSAYPSFPTHLNLNPNLAQAILAQAPTKDLCTLVPSASH